MKTGVITLIMSLCLWDTLTAMPVAAGQDCVDRILATCTSCHYQTRICEKLATKSQREWKTTLKRMLRYGLVLDETGQDTILDCLANLKKDSGKLCR
jgi:hypothetical protein